MISLLTEKLENAFAAICAVVTEGMSSVDVP
jgi:hypothetical protein